MILHRFLHRGLLAAVLATTLLSACEKVGETVSLGVRTEGTCSASKVIINGDGSHSSPFTPRFEGGEKVIINAVIKDISGSGSSAQLNAVPTASNYTVVYPASIVTNTSIQGSTTINVKLPDTQPYTTDDSGNQQVCMPMGAYLNSSEGTLSFKNLASLIRITVTNGQNADLVVKSIVLSSSSQPLCGSGTVDVTAASPSITLNSNGGKVIILSIPGGVSIANGSSKDFYMVVPAITSESTISFAVHTVGGDYLYTLNKATSSAITLERNMVATVTLNMSGMTGTAAPTYNLSGGKFLVNNNGQYVRFASGNLVYDESTGVCSFQAAQYTCGNSDYSAVPVGSRVWEHFGWSTASTTYGMNFSISNDDYAGAFIDWGNAVGSGWRTLTNSEWDYILTTRAGVTVGSNTNCHFTKAQVAGVNGIILLPNLVGDETETAFTWPNTVATPNSASWDKIGENNPYDFSSNTYSAADWNNLENAGCIFLPTAGYREGQTVRRKNSESDPIGSYWLATTNNSFYCLSITKKGVKVGTTSDRRHGRSVRLAQDCN